MLEYLNMPKCCLNVKTPLPMHPHLKAWIEIKVLRSSGAFLCTRFSGPDKVVQYKAFRIPMETLQLRAWNNLENLCAAASPSALTVGATR